MAEERMKVGGVAIARPRQAKGRNQGQKCKRSPFSKTSAGLDAAIVQPGERDRHGHSDKNVWQVNWAPAQPVELETIQIGEKVSPDSPDGQRLKRAGQKITQKNHPSGRKSNGGRKEVGNVRNFAAGIGNRGDKLAIHVSNGK